MTSGTEISDHASLRSLRPHLLRSGVFLAVIGVFVTCWMIGLTFSTLAALAQVGVRTPDLGPSTDAFLTLLGLGGIIVFGLGWLISLLVSVREFVDERDVLIEGGAERLAAVHEAVRARLAERCPPFTLQTGELEAGRTLRLHGKDAWALVTVQAVGPDLSVADMVTGAQVHDPRLVHAGSSLAMRTLLHRTIEDITENVER
jgi:hypothetical protein